jgi:hypothetical protein
MIDQGLGAARRLSAQWSQVRIVGTARASGRATVTKTLGRTVTGIEPR